MDFDGFDEAASVSLRLLLAALALEDVSKSAQVGPTMNIEGTADRCRTKCTEECAETGNDCMKVGMIQDVE